MGLLEMENAIVPVTGEFTKRFLRMETVKCAHCGAVIAVLKKGCTTEYQSKYTCGRCCGSICLFCAKQMQKNGGLCNPLQMKIDYAMKGNGWKNDIPWDGQGL